jgi:hypothetical protein
MAMASNLASAIAARQAGPAPQPMGGMGPKSRGAPPSYGGMGGGLMGGAAPPQMRMNPGGGKSGPPPPQYGAAGPAALAGQMRQDAVRGPAPGQMMR